MVEHKCHICNEKTDDIGCTSCGKLACVPHRAGCDSCWDMFCTACGRKCGDEWFCNYHADLYGK